MFIGYIPLSEKKSLIKFKDKGSDELLTIEEARQNDSYGGVLASGWICIDVDDLESSERLLDVVEQESLACRVYQTRRGKHFLFKNKDIEKNGTKKQTAFGIPCDCKVGGTNAYIVLKNNGKERKIVYDKFDDEEYDYIPKWLYPVLKYKRELVGLKEGDGRNEALYTFILHLQSEKFSKEEIRQTIRMTNKYLFDEPLGESELETILRDESFTVQKSFFEDKKFLIEEFCNYLKDNCYIRKINGEICTYREGIYIPGQAEVEKEMIKIIPGMTRNQRLEVYSYLDLLVEECNWVNAIDYIAFENGLLNLKTRHLESFSPNIYVTNKIHYKYNPKAESMFLEIILDRLSNRNSKIKTLLLEMVGYTMYRNNAFRKAFVLIGEKRNGKSTFIDMLMRLLGRDNYRSIDLKELNDQYKTAELAGKLACLGDDIDDDFIKSASVFKKLVSGESINARRIYAPPFDFINYSKLIFSANSFPRIRDTTGAVTDRLIFIPFEANFEPYLPDGTENPNFDPQIRQKLVGDELYESLIYASVSAFLGVLDRGGFTVPKESEDAVKDYEYVNNPIQSFFECFPIEKINEQPVNDVYITYKEFCYENGLIPLGKIEFSKKIKQKYNLEAKTKYSPIARRTVRVYTT